MSAGALTKIPDGGDLGPVIDAAKAALDLEDQRADRLDSKARNQMTLAGTWFGVVQAVAVFALASKTPVGWVISIAATAVLGGVTLGLAMWASNEVWKLRPLPAITQETLEDMVLAVKMNPETFATQLVQQYRHLLGHAQATNEKRADFLDVATRWWWATLAIGLAELALALLTRALSG